MLLKTIVANEVAEVNHPVAIFDKELLHTGFFKIQAFELCTMCGARFGIGYHSECVGDLHLTGETEELPKKLTEILAKDHRQNREHKHFIELDY
jgi:hypothetical protein